MWQRVSFDLLAACGPLQLSEGACYGQLLCHPCRRDAAGKSYSPCPLNSALPVWQHRPAAAYTRVQASAKALHCVRPTFTQDALPESFVFKAFNTIGLEHMAHPSGEGVFGGGAAAAARGPLTMLFAGAPEKREAAAAIISAVVRRRGGGGAISRACAGASSFLRLLQASAYLPYSTYCDPLPSRALHRAMSGPSAAHAIWSHSQSCGFTAAPRACRPIAHTTTHTQGFAPRYVGPIRYARNLESLAELWIHCGIGGAGLSDVDWGRDFAFQVVGGRGG